MNVRILITGGTIDGLEYDSEENAPDNFKSIIPNLLKKAKITEEYVVEQVCAKDSKFITDIDRKVIAEKIKKCPEEKIIITHGTATMSDTAKFLGRQSLTKTIVMLGAAIPANEENSDALFNLGGALTTVQILPPGVYVVMNGKILLWDNVKKDIASGAFVKER